MSACLYSPSQATLVPRPVGCAPSQKSLEEEERRELSGEDCVLLLVLHSCELADLLCLSPLSSKV